MSEKWEDPTNKEMRLYAEKAKRRKEGVAFNDKGNTRSPISDTHRPSNRNLQDVKVVGLEIPFGDILVLTFQGIFASFLWALLPGFILVSYLER
ncbi:MAG TPA: hypothetical protein EYQ30_13535 [Gammaproteobacteria bacterium]|jgi:hypothetical protein|nr:hypothetical protein [Gammaproteobacteria bacterium]